MRPSVLGSVAGTAVAAAMLVGAPLQAAAQAGPGGAAPDFLFQRPNVSIGLRGGMFFHRAGSDLYEFTTEHLTVESSDFRAVTLGGEVGVWLGSRAEAVVGLEGSRFTRESEFRDWVEEDGSPIRQSTRLTQGPWVSLGVRAYAFPRGEQLGQFIWIPRRVNAFAGGGAGFTAYRFEQWGDFVVEEEEGAFIETAELQDEGGTPFVHLSGGLEVSVSPRVALTAEARYHWGRDRLTEDFHRFEPLDLSGLRLVAGISYRF